MIPLAEMWLIFKICCGIGGIMACMWGLDKAMQVMKPQDGCVGYCIEQTRDPVDVCVNYCREEF